MLSGSLLVSQSATVMRSLEVNKSFEWGSLKMHTAEPLKKGGLIVDAQKHMVMILTGGADSSPDSVSAIGMADCNVYVSGGIGYRDAYGSLGRGVSVFGGDIFVSGAVYGPGGAIGSTSPGGSDPMIQYNNGGAFGGAAQLFYDDVNSRVGIGISTPSTDFHIRRAAPTITLQRDTDATDDSTLSFLKSDGTQVGYVRHVQNTNDLAIGTGNTVAERMRIKNDGNVGIGNTTPASILDISTDADTEVLVQQYNNGSDDPQVTLTKARGTFAGPTTVTSGDYLGTLSYSAQDTSTLSPWANIRLRSYGTVSPTSHPARFEVRTCADGSSVMNTAAVIAYSSVGGTISGSIHETVSGISYLKAGTGIGILSSSNGQVTITSTASGETYDLNAVQDGSNVDIKLDSTSGTDDSLVQLTAGTNITLTRNSSAEVTIDAAGTSAAGAANQIQRKDPSGSGLLADTNLWFTTGDGLGVSGSVKASDSIYADNWFAVRHDTNRVGIGTQSPDSLLEVTSGVSGETILSLEQHNSSNADAPNLNFVKSKGTIDTPLAVAAGDFLGDIQFTGYNGSSNSKHVQMYAQIPSSTTPGGTSYPGQLFIRTGKDGSANIKTAATFQAFDDGGTISGSIHHTAEGKSYLVQRTGLIINSGTNGQILAAATGSAASTHYSPEGPHRFSKALASELKSDPTQASIVLQTPYGYGAVMRSNAEYDGVCIRSRVPHWATKVKFILSWIVNQNATGKIEFRIAGRLNTNKEASARFVVATNPLSSNNLPATSGNWLDNNLDNGYRFFQNPNGVSYSSGNMNLAVATSDEFLIKDLINSADITAFENKGPGHVIDYCIIRNRTANPGDEVGSTTTDNLAAFVSLQGITVSYYN